MRRIAIYLTEKIAKNTLSRRPVGLALFRAQISPISKNKTLQSIIRVSCLRKMNKKTLVIIIKTYSSIKPKSAEISRTRVSADIRRTVNLFTKKENPN